MAKLSVTGTLLRVSMLLADAITISAVENGTRELSMGYHCTLDWTSGISPSGERYDAVQRGIRSNHIAVVPQARGGSELRLSDSAPQARKELLMMTDAEKMSLRDSVRGMPVDQAAALPLYDDVRGYISGGMPSEQYFAIRDGAVAGPRSQSPLEVRATAARDHYVEGLSRRWNSAAPTNDNRANEPMFARDGRLLADMPAHERARERSIIEQTNAWKR